MTDFHDCVQRGMALLDEQCQGWLGRIDTSLIDASSPYNSVLGQLYGHFLVAYDDIHLPIESLYEGERTRAARCGFELTHPDENQANYDLLSDEWRRAIIARSCDEVKR